MERNRAMTSPTREVFVGEICGVGSSSGVRVVVGRWPVSPFGSVIDAMVEDSTGRRSLIAADARLAEYISSIYAFDDVIVTPVTSARTPFGLTFTGGPLDIDIAFGRRDALGWALWCVPRRVAISRPWGTLTDLVARVAMDGVRTRGETPGGTEFYAPTDRHRVVSASGRWAGADLGALSAVDPPVRFGFSSTPRRPSVVGVTTTVLRRS